MQKYHCGVVVAVSAAGSGDELGDGSADGAGEGLDVGVAPGHPPFTFTHSPFSIQVQ